MQEKQKSAKKMKPKKPRYKHSSFRFLLILSLVFLAAGILLVFSQYYTNEKKEIHEMRYGNLLLHFRADLRKAANVPVIPSETVVRKMLLSENLHKVTIALPDVKFHAGYYGAAAFELSFKLTVIYNSLYSMFSHPKVFEKENATCLYYADSLKEICIGKIIFSNIRELKAKKGEVIIALLGGGYANTTSVRAFPEKNLILVEGRSVNETGRGYTDLDLAVDKLLLVLIGK